MKTFLANSLIPFLINSQPIFANGPRVVPKNLPYCIILEIFVFTHCITTNKLFAKADEFLKFIYQLLIIDMEN